MVVLVGALAQADRAKTANMQGKFKYVFRLFIAFTVIISLVTLRNRA